MSKSFPRLLSTQALSSITRSMVAEIISFSMSETQRTKMDANFPAALVAFSTLAIALSCCSPPNSTFIDLARSNGPMKMTSEVIRMSETKQVDREQETE